MNDGLMVGVDPGVKTGYSVHDIKTEKLLNYGLIRGFGLKPGPLESVLVLLKTTNVRYLVIENQYLGANPASLIRLVEARTAIVTCALLEGIEVLQPTPSEWISGILSVNTRIGRKFIKNASRTTVKLLYGIDPPQDVADAILIGRFGLGRVKYSNYISKNMVAV